MGKIRSLQDRPTDSEVELVMAGWYAEVFPRPPLCIGYDPVQAETETVVEGKAEATGETGQQAIPKSEHEANAWAILTLLFQNPFLKWNEILLETHLTDAKASKARAWLEQNNMAVARSVKIIGRPGLYLEIMAWVYENYRKKPPQGQGGFEHSCLCHYLKSWLIDRGYKVWLEAQVSGMTGRLDVFAWVEGSKAEMYGFEVTLSFSNLLDNIRDGLRSSLKRLYIVCRDQAETNKARNIAKKYIGDVNRLEFSPVSEFSQKKEKLE